MPELLKNIYNKAFFDEFILAIQQFVPNFSKSSFLGQIYEGQWETLELKQRMRHLSNVLSYHLPHDYGEAVTIIANLADHLKKTKEERFEYMFLPDFIEEYGLKDFDISTEAMEKITQFISCEFAVRPFILKYGQQMMIKMLKWSSHKHHAVRRLASEGCRPRLPWAMALPPLKEDPNPIIPILENLKNDPSESVRRSVANNLNDISKDNPYRVISFTKTWKGKAVNTDWVLKHGCRTLLKQGNTEALEIFGFGSTQNLKIEAFHIHISKVKMGDELKFSFQLINDNNSPVKTRLEYGLYYQKANGSLSKKVFKISEKKYPENSSTLIVRKHSFRLITTRKFYAGRHQLSIIMNGMEVEKLNFELRH